jgi:UDP-N-acetylglucosamine 2-epimerase (non-hydrolysing)
MFEILNHFKEAIEKSKILKELKLKGNKYFLVSAHREENINNPTNFKALMESLNALAERYSIPVIVSTHPRTKKQIEVSKFKSNPLIQWLHPQGYFDYNKLQKNAFIVLSDSGTISEESSILNFKALNIREAHERPEAMEEASTMMVGLNPERILQGIEQVKDQKINNERDFRLVKDYAMPNVSSKVVRVIISYIDYINRVVWNK